MRWSLLSSLSLIVASLARALPHDPPHPRQGGDPKLVFAHHLVGNTYTYTQQDWLDDINAAHAADIDAFALNIGSDSWQWDRVASA